MQQPSGYSGSIEFESYMRNSARWRANTRLIGLIISILFFMLLVSAVQQPQPCGMGRYPGKQRVLYESPHRPTCTVLCLYHSAKAVIHESGSAQQ